MKKYITLMAMMAMTMVIFVSCDTDNDDYAAYNLEGAWEGDMGVSMFMGNTEYFATYSTIYFAQDPYRYASGTGYQVDYFNDQSPWYHRSRNTYYIANHFEWEVNNGIIYIHYLEEDVYAQIAPDYLSDYDGYFRGVIKYENGAWSEFRLRKTYSPNDWNTYYDWGWDYGYGYGYAKKNPVFTDDDGNNIVIKNTAEKPIRGARK